MRSQMPYVSFIRITELQKLHTNYIAFYVQEINEIRGWVSFKSYLISEKTI